jgi:hypothetical protein
MNQTLDGEIGTGSGFGFTHPHEAVAKKNPTRKIVPIVNVEPINNLMRAPI